MLEFLTRWPAWYVLLSAYCVYLGIDAFRHYRAAAPALASAAAAATTPHDRGRVAGVRVRRLAPALAWAAGGIALWTGADWVRAALLVAFAISGRAAFRDFAVGHATGRKSAELAAALEYVTGRARPGPVDYAVSGAYVALTHVLPAAALLYAMWAL